MSEGAEGDLRKGKTRAYKAQIQGKLDFIHLAAPYLPVIPFKEITTLLMRTRKGEPLISFRLSGKSSVVLVRYFTTIRGISTAKTLGNPVRCHKTQRRNYSIIIIRLLCLLVPMHSHYLTPALPYIKDGCADCMKYLSC